MGLHGDQQDESIEPKGIIAREHGVVRAPKLRNCEHSKAEQNRPTAPTELTHLPLPDGCGTANIARRTEPPHNSAYRQGTDVPGGSEAPRQLELALQGRMPHVSRSIMRTIT